MADLAHRAEPLRAVAFRGAGLPGIVSNWKLEMYGAIVHGFRDESLSYGESIDVGKNELASVMLRKPPCHYDSFGGYEVS